MSAPKPTNVGRSANPLRPDSLADMIGQERTKALMQRVIRATQERRQPLDHVLLVGPSGTGKSTLANVIANELRADCYQVEAPVSHDTLLSLRVRDAERSGKPLTDAKKKELRDEMRRRYDEQTDIRYGAARGWVDAIIEPHTTRQWLAAAQLSRRSPAPTPEQAIPELLECVVFRFGGTPRTPQLSKDRKQSQ